MAVAMTHPLFPVGPTTDMAVRRGLETIIGVEILDRRLRDKLGMYMGLIMYLASLEYEEGRRLGHKK